MIGVRRSAGQRVFESMTGSAFPKWKVLPEKIVESPDHTPTRRRERFQINPLARCGRRVSRVVYSIDEFLLERILLNLSQVHCNFDPRQNFLTSNGPT